MAGATLLIAWGAFAFGAVYPWSYVPLAAGAAAWGAWSLYGRRVDSLRRPSIPAGVIVALLACAGAVSLQLIPLPVHLLATLSPNAHRLLTSFDLRFGIEGARMHPLSIDPRATMIAWGMLLSLTVLVAGASRRMTAGGVRTLAGGIAIIGTLVALTGIVQRPLYHGAIYGVWTPQMAGSTPFGPFVNKNHFAGWMMMALSVSLGYLFGRLAVGLKDVNSGLRERLVWLGSADASQIVLLAGGVLVMALSQVLTFSRSGIVCLFASVLVMGGFLIRRRHTVGRSALRAYLALVIIVAIGWAGVDAVGSRLRETAHNSAARRTAPWLDAIDIARAFQPFGSGMNTYGITTLFLQTRDRRVHYTEAHNDYLQVLAEGGVLVAIPAAIAALTTVGTIRRRFRGNDDDEIVWWTRAGAVGGLVAIALQELVDFSLQIPGNAVLFAILLALAIHDPGPGHRRVHA